MFRIAAIIYEKITDDPIGILSCIWIVVKKSPLPTTEVTTVANTSFNPSSLFSSMLFTLPPDNF